jgi:hemerythrin
MENTVLWTPDLSIGVNEIDEQHKEMIARVNELQTAVREGRGEAELGRIIDFAAEYVYFHFNAEEEVMKSSGYPAYDAHKTIHDSFVQDLVRIMKDFEASKNDGELVIRVAKGLDKWIRDHIKQVDQELGVFLKARQ